jgi:outer membrane receptor protein involved in Fe transport
MTHQVRGRAWVPTLAFLLATAMYFVPADAGAQSSCASPARGVSRPQWTGALARTISLHGRDISLREALDRLSATARIRLSYTAELLPLASAVCLAYESAPVGDILTDLLDGAAVHPVVVGVDQIVLAPLPHQESVATGPAPAAMLNKVGVLDRVVVTGSASGASQRSLPIALDVITGQQLSQRGTGTLSSALNGAVPGLWLWEQSPLTLLARYGSIRGASSFGVSYPKVYVDGIEVANSLLVTRLDPDAVSRIEVIRGPQGAALYGADAISGVINIVTRQEGTEGGAPRAQFTTAGGASASAFSASNVLAQNHSFSTRAGSGVRAARLGLNVTTIGAFIPDAFSRQLSANAGARFVGARSLITGTFRFFAQDARTPLSPLLAGLVTATPVASSQLATQSDARLRRDRQRTYLLQPDSLSGTLIRDSSDRQSVRQYTLGGIATIRSGDRWTHSAVVGLDGYRLKSGSVLDGAFTSLADSALNAARGSAIRGTIRASTVGEFGDRDRRSATVTLAAEYSQIRDETESEAPFALYRPRDERPDDGGPGESEAPSYIGGPGNPLVDVRSNTGLIAQTNAAFNDAVFVSGGLRLERNTGLTGISEYETLPMLGAAFVRSLGFATVKLRSAYGKGIRPPQTSSRSGTLMGLNRSTTSIPLSAETQSGIESGVDAFVGRALAVHLTRFDQRASGLIQPVSVAPPLAPGDTTRPRRIAYELQNVGEITNRGWELEGSATNGIFSVGATFSSVDSRVRKLANGYTGELRIGDRMLEVPARTFGVNASVTKKRWFTAWSVSRASDWVNYDRIALAAAFANESHPLGEFWGSQLRTYWRKYDGVTRLAGNLGYNFGRGLAFTIRGENLLDKQEGEPDNVTVLPGRTVTAGLRLSF